MKVRTNVKAGGQKTEGIAMNRCEAIVKKNRPLRVRTGVKAGGWSNRCEAIARARR